MRGWLGINLYPSLTGFEWLDFASMIQASEMVWAAHRREQRHTLRGLVESEGI